MEPATQGMACAGLDNTNTTEHSGLSIPAQTAVDRSSPSLKPRAITQWISELPLAHTTQTALALTKHIEQINRISYPLALRFKAMEILQATVQTTLGGLRNNSHTSQWSPTDRTRQQHCINISLLNAVSVSYQICVVDLLQQTDNPSRRALATALHRAQQALGNVLLCTYTKYTSAPKNIWYTLHQLYLIARSFKCKDRSVKNVMGINPAYSSVAFEYKRQLLIQLAGPDRLLDTQISELNTLAETWAHDIDLDIYIEQHASDSMFIIDPLEDKPPVRHSLTTEHGMEPMYTINLSVLSERLLAILQAGKEGGEIPTISGVKPSGTLIKLLLSDWMRGNKRVFKRTRQTGSLQAAMGLTNSFNFIDHNNGSNAQKQAERFSAPLELTQNENDRSTNFVRNQFDGNISDYAARFKNTSLGHNANISLQSEKLHIHHCRIINVSANGYCLQRQENSPARVQIGDVVALHEPDNAHALHSSIGVVRWLHYEAGNGLSFGVQVLSPMAQPLRTGYAKGMRKVFYPGLGLPEMPALQQAASILTSTHRYNSGDEIQISKGHQKINIKLGERLDRHRGYDRFKYEIQIKK